MTHTKRLDKLEGQTKDFQIAFHLKKAFGLRHGQKPNYKQLAAALVADLDCSKDASEPVNVSKIIQEVFGRGQQ
jgi:hypothetical protein